MKLSITTTFSETRQEPWKESLDCYMELADEIIVVYDPKESYLDGYLSSCKKIKTVKMDWPFEYDWSEFPRHYNASLEAASGDWVINMPIDFMIHENEFDQLRKVLLNNDNADVATLNKINVVGNYYYSKGNVPIGINKAKHGDSLKFGGIKGSVNDDLAGVVVVESVEGNVPYGKIPNLIIKTGVSVFNFDYCFKDEAVAHRDFARMARAYMRYFNTPLFGGSDKEAIEFYNRLRAERKEKAISKLQPQMLPKYARELYSHL